MLSAVVDSLRVETAVASLVVCVSNESIAFLHFSCLFSSVSCLDLSDVVDALSKEAVVASLVVCVFRYSMIFLDSSCLSSNKSTLELSLTCLALSAVEYALSVEAAVASLAVCVNKESMVLLNSFCLSLKKLSRIKYLCALLHLANSVVAKFLLFISPPYSEIFGFHCTLGSTMADWQRIIFLSRMFAPSVSMFGCHESRQCCT